MGPRELSDKADHSCCIFLSTKVFSELLTLTDAAVESLGGISLLLFICIAHADLAT